MTGLIHPQPSGGALILAQAGIKFIAIKSVQIGGDFRQPFGPGLPSFEGGQACFLGPSPAQPPITVKTCQGTEQFAEGSDGR